MPIVSEAVIVRVTTSPLLALPVLSTAIPTAVRVGCVLSIVTEPDVALVIADAIALPAMSEYVQENPTAPSSSALATVTAAVWLSSPVVP